MTAKNRLISQRVEDASLRRYGVSVGIAFQRCCIFRVQVIVRGLHKSWRWRQLAALNVRYAFGIVTWHNPGEGSFITTGVRNLTLCMIRVICCLGPTQDFGVCRSSPIHVNRKTVRQRFRAVAITHTEKTALPPPPKAIFCFTLKMFKVLTSMK